MTYARRPPTLLEVSIRKVAATHGRFPPDHLDVDGVGEWLINDLYANQGGGGPHTHDAADITTGTLASARLPVATTAARGATKVDNDSAGDPVALTSSGHGAGADPHPQYALDAEKGAASGIATLDAGGKLASGQIPFGNTATTVRAGNDPSHTNERTPVTHDILTKHSGFPGGTANFLREDGTWALPGGGGGGAPTDAEYVVAVAHVGLSAERVLTGVANHTAIDNATAGQSKISVQPHLDAADPHPQYALDSEKGVASGYASLDAATKVPIAQLPAHRSSHMPGGSDVLQLSATSRVVGRKTAAGGAIEELTLSEILDFIGSAAEGDILYRAAAAWARLPKGTANQVLTMNAGATAPEWKAGGGGGGNDPRITYIERTSDYVSTGVSLQLAGLSTTLPPGTYWFEYRCIWQTSAVGTAIRLGVQQSSTNPSDRYVAEATGYENTTAASTGAQDGEHAAFGLRAGGQSRTVDTLGTTSFFAPTSVDTANADLMTIIKGVIRIPAGFGDGSISLLFGSEATGSTQTLRSGSSLRVEKVSA